MKREQLPALDVPVDCVSQCWSGFMRSTCHKAGHSKTLGILTRRVCAVKASLVFPTSHCTAGGYFGPLLVGVHMVNFWTCTTGDVIHPRRPCMNFCWYCWVALFDHHV